MSRDIEPLKSKYEKLANTKKPTGDRAFPTHVRRAKHIVREMFKLNRANSGVVRISNDNEVNGSDYGVNSDTKEAVMNQSSYKEDAQSRLNEPNGNPMSIGSSSKRRIANTAG